MPGSREPSAKKVAFVERFNNLLDTYKTIVVAEADNVKSQQFHNARKALRTIGATMLMGKNTILRRALKDRVKREPSFADTADKLMPLLKWNVGMIFSDDKAAEVYQILKDNRVQAPARAGTMAPADVWVPACNTGLEPTKTQIFQQLNIPTKIVKQSVEILKDVQLVKANTKVGASEAGLLVLLNIRPFHYGLDVTSVYDDGVVYSKEVLEITDAEFTEKLTAGVDNVRALALGCNYTCAATLPAVLQSALKNAISLSIATDYTPSRVGGIVSDVREGKVAAAPAAGGGGGGGAKKEDKKAEPEPEEEDEEEGFDLPW